MSEYRCSVCEGYLTVTPDPIHSGGMVVEPCEHCISKCEECMWEETP